MKDENFLKKLRKPKENATVPDEEYTLVDMVRMSYT